MQPNSILAIAPSFTCYSSAQFAEIAAKVIREIRIEEEQKQLQNPNTSDLDFAPEPDLDPTQQRRRDDEDAAADTEEDDDDGEFTFVCQDPDAFTISADEIFSNGQIRPIYPIFNRDLIVEHGDGDKGKNLSPSIRLPLRKILINGRDASPVSSSPSTSSSPESDSLTGIPNGKYCLWSPKSAPPETPDRCKKSNSTGSSKRWRFRDLLHRSSSDGKDTFVFLSTAAIKRGEKEKEKTEKSISSFSTSTSSSTSAAASKGKTVSAHEMHYVRNRKMREGDRHRSYLPYKQDLVGFFANVNGLSKSFHPI
eukprot:TRINITY_DN1975_c0_g1_i5.p1 TRINITY_DN1975_c0_g1~~TRINITY_DN1975_c0_g1_i5.p1  ORF type:complete len:309 (+),score=33.55 TRINITY_DN1975_c0_g1_i5:190-1116(+)